MFLFSFLLLLFFLIVLFCLFLIFYIWKFLFHIFYLFLIFIFCLFIDFFVNNVLFYLVKIIFILFYMFLFSFLLLLFFLTVLFCLFLIFYIWKFLFHIFYFFGGYISFMFMFYFNINFFNFIFYFNIFIFILLFFNLFKFLNTISISSYKFFYLMFYIGIFYILILFVMSVFNIIFLFFSCFNFTFLMQCVVICIMIYYFGIWGSIPFLDLIFENCFYNLLLIFFNIICFIFILLLFYFYFNCLFNFCFSFKGFVYSSSGVSLSSSSCFLNAPVSSLSTTSNSFVKDSSGLYLCNVFFNLDSVVYNNLYQDTVVLNNNSFNVYCSEEEFNCVNGLFADIVEFDSKVVKSVDLCVYKLGCIVYFNICLLKGYDFVDSDYFLLHFNSEMSCSFYAKSVSGEVFYSNVLVALDLDFWISNIGSDGFFKNDYLNCLDDGSGYFNVYNYDISIVNCFSNSFLCNFPVVSYDSLVLDLEVLNSVWNGDNVAINNFVSSNNSKAYNKFDIVHSSEALSLLCVLSSDYQHYLLNCGGSCGSSN